jgi:hypothetical protein
VISEAIFISSRSLGRRVGLSVWTADRVPPAANCSRDIDERLAKSESTKRPPRAGQAAGGRVDYLQTTPASAADGSGQIVDLYGRKTSRKATPLHMNLSDRGV